MNNQNGNGTYRPPEQPGQNQTQYLFPPNNPETTPFQQPQAGYNANQYGAQQYANPNAQYPNQGYAANQMSNNAYYAPQTNYAAYSPQPPKKKGSSPLLYVLIVLMSICFVAVVGLCVYFVMDSDSDETVSRPSRTEARLQETTEVPTEEESEAETEAPTMATEAPVIVTEPPQMHSEEPHNFYDDYGYLDELNRRYDNYFDFYPDEDGYVIADSSYRLISKQDLYGMTEHEVCIARNEIYARYGYIFQTEKYNAYFQNFSWYRPSTRTLPNLNSIEAQNVNTIMAYENERGW